MQLRYRRWSIRSVCSIFQAGPNVEFDQIQIQVLGRDPFPTLNQTYSYVRQEESQKECYASPSYTKQVCYGSQVFTKWRPLAEIDLRCDYCGKKRHTREKFWQLNERSNRGWGGKKVDTRRQAPMTDVNRGGLQAFLKKMWWPATDGKSQAGSFSHCETFPLCAYRYLPLYLMSTKS